MTLKHIFKDYGLLWAMVVGAIFYPYLYHFSSILKYTLFVMLFFSYTKIKPTDLKVEKMHYVLFALQWMIGILAYIVVEPFDELLAQGIALIILTPTATASAVITMMLGGSIAFITSFLIPCNILISFIAPLIIGWLYPDQAGSYIETTLSILGQVSFLLILPLVIVWALRYLTPRFHDRLTHLTSVTYYVWMFSVTIITANTIYSFETNEHLTLQFGLMSGALSFVAACTLYFIGQKTGAYFDGKRIEGRQAFGQKNTVLAIWIALTFMNPVVAIVPSFYVAWQNVLNSFELAIFRREQAKLKEASKS